MYIRGVIPLNFAELAAAVLIATWGYKDLIVEYYKHEILVFYSLFTPCFAYM